MIWKGGSIVEKDLVKSGDLPPGFARSFATWEELRPQVEQRQPLVLGQGKLDGHSTSVGSSLGRSFHPGPRWGGQLRRVIEQVDAMRQKGDRVVVVTRQAARLADLFQEEGILVGVQEDLPERPPASSISIVQGQFDEGWRLEDEQDEIVFLTDAEIFGWGKARRRRSRRPRAASPESFFADIHPGDYVVHMEHGIGRLWG